MARDEGSDFHFCGFAIVVHGGSLSNPAPAAKNPGGRRTGPPREVVEISSDEEEEDGSAAVARKLRFETAAATGGSDLAVGKKSNSCVGKEDDDCVVLDSDPDGAVSALKVDVSLDELQIVAEKGQVMYSRQTGQSRGFGIVTMSTVKEAELAVEMFNCFKMHGRRLTVQHKAARRVARVEVPLSQSESPFRIYVGNLPSQASDSWLEELFSKNGKVVEARVVKEHDGWTWRSRGFGFVKMATEEESYVAIEALDKKVSIPQLVGSGWLSFV
ncbi:hypothetical protein ACQ4PT_047840 [Festuca glaucescens]